MHDMCVYIYETINRANLKLIIIQEEIQVKGTKKPVFNKITDKNFQNLKRYPLEYKRHTEHHVGSKGIFPIT